MFVWWFWIFCWLGSFWLWGLVVRLVFWWFDFVLDGCGWLDVCIMWLVYGCFWWSFFDLLGCGGYWDVWLVDWLVLRGLLCLWWCGFVGGCGYRLLFFDRWFWLWYSFVGWCWCVFCLLWWIWFVYFCVDCLVVSCVFCYSLWCRWYCCECLFFFLVCWLRWYCVCLESYWYLLEILVWWIVRCFWCFCCCWGFWLVLDGLCCWICCGCWLRWRFFVWWLDSCYCFVVWFWCVVFLDWFWYVVWLGLLCWFSCSWLFWVDRLFFGYWCYVYEWLNMCYGLGLDIW